MNNSLRAAALLSIRRRAAGVSYDTGAPRLEVFTEDAETGDVVAWPDGRRYTPEQWSWRVRTAPYGWHGKIYRGVDLDRV
jgi:hypothetical protein